MYSPLFHVKQASRREWESLLTPLHGELSSQSGTTHSTSSKPSHFEQQVLEISRRYAGNPTCLRERFRANLRELLPGLVRKRRELHIWEVVTQPEIGLFS